MAETYPDHAKRMDIDGGAKISCTVSPQGKLADCAVTEEEPAGEAFGAAALKISRIFKMKPVGKDGSSVVGGQFTIRIRWTMHRPLP